MGLSKRQERITLIFDGECGFCTFAAGVIRALDKKDRVAALPFQRPGVPEAAGLRREQCVEAAWAITPDGRRYRGAAAVHTAIAWAIGRPGLAALYRLAPIRLVEDTVYLLISRFRSSLPGVMPFCTRSPRNCR